MGGPVVGRCFSRRALRSCGGARTDERPANHAEQRPHRQRSWRRHSCGGAAVDVVIVCAGHRDLNEQRARHLR
eukprot:6000598-Prymnesium_polylepis.1